MFVRCLSVVCGVFVGVFGCLWVFVNCLRVFLGACGVCMGVCGVFLGPCYYVYMYTGFVYTYMCSGVKLCPTCYCRGGVCGVLLLCIHICVVE